MAQLHFQSGIPSLTLFDASKFLHLSLNLFGGDA